MLLNAKNHDYNILIPYLRIIVEDTTLNADITKWQSTVGIILGMFVICVTITQRGIK